ncbi:MAG: hypothetical protein ACTSUC_09630 [Promethearchaeota archaeon]
MSELSKLIGKSQTFKIGEIELEIAPLTLADIDLVVNLQDAEKQGEAMKELIKRTLKISIEDATDEEIDKISFKHFKELSEAIVEVNGLNVNANTA